MISKAIMGKKVGITQFFTDKGEVVPVTVVEAGPCQVVQKKTLERDGYEALKIGFVDAKERLLNRPDMGQFKKHQLNPKRFLKEVKLKDITPYNVGDDITVEIFESGDRIDVSGTSKGKGFAGGVKRWNFARGPMSHGSRFHRSPGSSGATGPAKVFKGHKGPGRLGGENVTVQNLEVVKVDPDKNLLLIKGSVPGPKRSILLIKSTVKGRK